MGTNLYEYVSRKSLPAGVSVSFSDPGPRDDDVAIRLTFDSGGDIDVYGEDQHTEVFTSTTTARRLRDALTVALALTKGEE